MYSWYDSELGLYLDWWAPEPLFTTAELGYLSEEAEGSQAAKISPVIKESERGLQIPQRHSQTTHHCSHQQQCLSA